MKEVQFYKEIGLIDDDLILEAETVSKKSARQKVRIKWVAVAACLAVFAMFGTAFAVSAEFREFVISFFKSEQIETLPPSYQSEQNSFLGQQEIDGIAQISYYQFDSNFEIYDNTIATRAKDGQLKIYKLEDKEFVELTQHRIDDTIKINGRDIPLGFVYVIDSGMIKTFDNIHEPATDEQATAIWSVESNFVWVNLSIRRELDTYVCYDLKTGEVRDVISEAGIVTDADTQVSFSPDGRTILVCKPHTAFLVDVEAVTVQELTSISTLDELSISFIDNETLSVWQQHMDGEDVRFTVFSYNIESGEKTTVIQDMPYYSGSASGIMSLGKGVTILVEPEQYILVDEKSGIRYAIEELELDSSTDFLLSPNRKRVSVVIMSGQNGLGITQIGYINIEKQELRVFDRKDFSENIETSMYWISNNELAVTANSEARYLYIYRFE